MNVTEKKIALVLFLIFLPAFFVVPQVNLLHIHMTSQSPDPFSDTEFSVNADFAFIEWGQYDDDGGLARGVAIKDNIAYLANGDQGLEMINITNPLNPVKIGVHELNGAYAQDVYIDERDYAYVSCGARGVKIVDISDPYDTRSMLSIDPDGDEDSIEYVIEVDMRETILHIATVADGVYIWDVADIYHPNFMSKYEDVNIFTGISVLGKFVSVSAGAGGLEIIDLTFPDTPFMIGNWNDSSCYAAGVASANIGNVRIAFLANSINGLDLINFSAPNLPGKIGEFTGVGSVVDVEIVDDVAYCCSAEYGLVLVDVSDPFNPTELSRYNTDGQCLDVSVSNNITVIADQYGGMKIFDSVNPSAITFLSRFFDHGQALKVEVVGDIAYVLDGDEVGLEILDISDPKIPQLLGKYHEPSLSIVDMQIKDDLAVLSVFQNGIIFLNISDPTNPQKISEYVDGNFYQVTLIDGNILYCGSFNQSIYALNITDLQSITILDSFNYPIIYPVVTSMVLLNDELYVGATSYSMIKLNVSDPTNLNRTYTFSGLTDVNDLYLNESTLYTASLSWGIYVVNLTSLDFVQKDTGFSYAYHVTVVGDNVAVALQGSGLTVIDPSKTSGYIVGGYSSKDIFDIQVVGQYLVTAAGEDGLVLLAFDSDGDGITDSDEEDIWGTDPFDEDTDDDDMPDGFEIEFGLDPLDPTDRDEDLDLDDLTNFWEYVYGTDPTNSDTEGDGMPDGWEKANNLDPLVDDSAEDYDHDWLTSLEEYYYGTDPTKKDTDGDDADDGLEVFYGTDPLDPNDYPNKRLLNRLAIALPVGVVVLIAVIIINVLTLRKNVKRNKERELEVMAEEEEEILVF
ncbi:MAG: hypothetical protein ACTSWD_02780 [Candidatus Heimdallarchaeota archaeon]